MELATHLRANSTLGGGLEQSTPRVDFASQPSSPTHTAASHPAVLKSVPATGGSAGRPDSSSKHKQPAGRVVLQPSSQTLTTATQPAVAMTVQGSNGMAGRLAEASKHRPPDVLEVAAQLPARVELCTLAPAGSWGWS